MRARRGQTTVEFALVLPILTILLFGIVEIGYLFFQGLTVSRATRAAARLGAVRATDSTIKSYVQSQCGGMTIASNKITILVRDAKGVAQTAGDRTPGNFLKVTVAYVPIFLTQVDKLLTFSGFTASSEFVIE